MERQFAGTLGSLALLFVLIQGWMTGGGMSDVLPTAWLALIGFTAWGWIAGWIARYIIDDAIRARFVAELAAETSRAENKTAPAAEKGKR